MNSAATAIAALESMTIDERIAEVAKDVLTRADRYKDIPAEDLAALLGVSGPDYEPGWEFVHYVPHLSVEELLEDYGYGIEDMLSLLRGTVSPERIEELEKATEGLDDKSALSLLSADEQRACERRDQEDTYDDYGCTIGYCEVQSAYDKLLMFEAKFDGEDEDDEWEDLRTPYDRRDGKFTDLTKCLIDEGEALAPFAGAF